MMSPFVFSLPALLLCSTSLGRAWGDFEFFSRGSPLVQHVSAADPDAHVWDNVIWVYSSTDANLKNHGMGPNDSWTYEHMDGYHAFSSTDMVNWIDHGEVFHSRYVAWGPPGWMWAPSAAWNGKRGDDGMYYLYYPHRDFDDKWRIGVATAPTPTGPFTDVGPLKGIQGIDPKLFTDDDGQSYLYFNSAAVVKMKDNMIEIDEEPRSIDFGESSLEEKFRFEEGSFIHKKGNMYYYSYSNWQARDTTSYYATGRSPYGPFQWKGALSGKKSGSQDHHSIIQFKGKWYYFYHMDTPWNVKEDMEWYGQRRIACYTQMYHSKRGDSIRLVNPTSFLVNSGTADPYTSNSGEMYQWDLWYTASGRFTTDALIAGTRDVALYSSYRSEEKFSYDVPLANGKYDVTFMFAEVYHDEAGKRSFDVTMEGQRVITNLDVFRLVGKDTAYDVRRTVSVTDNELNIVFSASVDKAMIAAMKIVRKRCLLLRWQ